MELIGLFLELLQSLAEHLVSYRAGQAALRGLDRALWTLEKTAKWAVPPPLEQDTRAQPELVRPLPWLLFLPLLLLLRGARETASLLHLAMGKPPLRSADVVAFIQHKRRYLRTLKYQGSRLMRARTGGAAPGGWRALLDYTMCFNRQLNNNTDQQQMLVVKRNKNRAREAAAGAAAAENTMDRLIEKMMIDLNAGDSDDDSSYTLTNAASIKSDTDSESDRETVFSNDVSVSTPNKHAMSTPEKGDNAVFTPEKEVSALEPEDQSKSTTVNPNDITLTDEESKKSQNSISKANSSNHNSNNSKSKSESVILPPKNDVNHANNKSDVSKPNDPCDPFKNEDVKYNSAKEETLSFIQGEKNSSKQQQKKKIANDRGSNSSPGKKTGRYADRRELSAPAMRVTSNNGSPVRENNRHREAASFYD